MAADRRRARQEALVRVLDAEALDGLVVTSHANIRYLTGFSGSAAVVAVTRADVLVVTDFRYDEQARAEAGEVARVEVDSTSVWDRFFQELATLGPLGTLGYEAHALSVHDAERFAQAGKAWRWVPTTELVERLRAAKDEGEVAAIRGAAQLAGEALRQTLVQVRPGMTELAIAGVLEGALRRLGSEGHPFATIVASGPRSALPHARSSRRAVAAGEWLLLDFGAQVDGYCADITRTVVVGARATERQRVLYGLVREAQQRARAGVRAGMTGRDADALARDPIAARGFGEAFERRADGPVGARVTLGAMNLDIIAQLVKILREAPELGAIEVRRGLFGAWSSVRVSKAGHTTNESGQHVVLAQAHAPAAAAARRALRQGRDSGRDRPSRLHHRSDEDHERNRVRSRGRGAGGPGGERAARRVRTAPLPGGPPWLKHPKPDKRRSTSRQPSPRWCSATRRTCCSRWVGRPPFG